MTAPTIYYGVNAGGGGNTPLTTDLGTALVATSATAGTGPATGAYLYGFMDGEQKFRSFYSSSANSISLPTLVQPPVVPTNFYSCGTAGAGVVYQLVQTGSDYGTGTTGFAGQGMYMVTLSFAAGSPDAASPFQFFLDQQCLLIVSNATSGYEGT